MADPIDGAIGELALTALGARRQPAARGEFLSHLVDTQVLSERRRKLPQPEVVAWLAHRPRQTLYLSVLTTGEFRKSIERLDAARQQPLLDWLEVALPNHFMGRLLAVGAQTAGRWGRLLGSAGRPLPAVDSPLAATALQHNLTLGTRHTADFEGTGARLINPWMAHSAPGNSTQRKQLESDPPAPDPPPLFLPPLQARSLQGRAAAWHLPAGAHDAPSALSPGGKRRALAGCGVRPAQRNRLSKGQGGALRQRG